MENNKQNTILYLTAMLKAYGINKIVSCPGTQNSNFNSIVQEDLFFKCYSVVDERSACYIANGIAYETKEPVVITCTGATASRNFLSGMTEAYYKNLPIIAITFFDVKTNTLKLSPQYIDRSVTQNDVKRISVSLPVIHDEKDKKDCIIALNAALSSAKYNGTPVHINAPNIMDFEKYDLPSDIWTTKVYSEVDRETEEELKNRNTIIYIGSHNKFSSEEEGAISVFAKNYNIPVVVDHTSNYHGANKIMSSRLSVLAAIEQKPELIIDMGGISGEYLSFPLFKKAKIWRISPNGEFCCRTGQRVEKQFNMTEFNFFSSFKNSDDNEYLDYIKDAINNITIPELPLSNPFICLELSKNIQNNSSLHLAILNSLRSMNFFDLDNSIDVNCNVGGFGIDGALSTLTGQSLTDSNKKFYGVIGDLAFFYDMNVLGNRHLGKNLRIILVNNNRGEEFRLNPKLETPLGEKSDILIAAAGHYKNGAKGWVESCGLKYMSASTKEEFLSQISDFCSKDFNSSVVFEVFVKDEDEKEALNILKTKTAPKEKKEEKSLLQKIFKLH